MKLSIFVSDTGISAKPDVVSPEIPGDISFVIIALTSVKMADNSNVAWSVEFDCMSRD